MIRIAIVLWLALFGIANAQLAGGLQFPGPGTPAASAITFAITFGSSQEDTSSATSYTIPTVGVGAADPNRYAVIAVCIRSASPVTTPTVTVGGAATTKVIEQISGTSYSGLFQTNSPFTTGTTATVVLSSFGAAAARAAVQGYSVVTGTGTIPSGGAVSGMSSAGSTTETAAITLPSNGSAIGAICSSANVIPITVTAPAAGTLKDKDAVIAASSTTTFSMHDTATRTGSTTYTFSSGSSFSAAQTGAVVAAWGP